MSPHSRPFLLLLVVLLPLACLEPLATAVPEPAPVGAAHLPEAGERVYFLLNVGDTAELFRRGARRLLTDAVERGLPVAEAWYPAHGSPCLSLNAVEALVVRLHRPAPRIGRLGYRADPAPYAANCGIDRFAYYRF